MNAHRNMRTPAGAAAAVAISLLVAGPATSTNALAGGATVNLKQELASTGADPDASGKLRFVMKTSTEARLVVQAHRLAPDATFDVLADGVKVGTIATTGGGGGKLRLRSVPRSRDQVLGFDPRGTNLVVRDGDGDDVLAVAVDDDSVDPGQIACCIPDDSGAECEDRTADECAAQGGTPTTSSSCLPNPCDGAGVPNRDIVCCIPDDSGAECEDRTPSACAAEGGTVVEATSCASNPCAGTAPADGEIACCVPHATAGEPDECETETPATCAALGGTATDATSCASDPCGTGVGGGSDDSGSDDSGTDDSGSDDSGADDSGHHGGSGSGGSGGGSDD